MSLFSLLNQTLNKLHNETASPETVIEGSVKDIHMKIELIDRDRLGIKCSRIVLENTSIDILRMDEIVKKAGELEKITLFEENLKLIEKDRESLTVLLRSMEVYKEDKDIASYYEIIFRNGNFIELKRYEYNNSLKSRQSIPFVLSRQVLERYLITVEKILTLTIF
jgi:hypothetical protein